MPTDLTFIHTVSSGPAGECARACEHSAGALGFSTRITELSAFSGGELLEGGTLLFFLGSAGAGEPPRDAIPFWFHLHSLNRGALRNLRFAVCALGDSRREQFCAFGNACNAKFGQLGGTRLCPILTRDGTGKDSRALHGWLESVLAKLVPSMAPRWEALAA